MIEALKKLDKKFLITAGLLIFIPILILILLAIIQGCSNKKVNYSTYENKMITAATNYFKKNNLLPTKEAEIKTVKLDKLVSDKYIKSPKKMLGDDTCTGSVSVRMNGSSIEENNGGYLNYTVNLKCKDYSTVHLVDKIKENIVTSDSGLYKDGNMYIFKGDEPKNYITFYGQKYRIMSVDQNGILKLIKEQTKGSTIWDSKFNTEINYSYGKNIYKDSSILKTLKNDYLNKQNISTKARNYIVAYDSCIGKRKINDLSISREVDCSEKLESQVISLINVSDYAMASLDPECNSIYSRSCNNYNYLYRVINTTWTMNAVKDNTYQVLYISSGLARYNKASIYNPYNFVIYIDGNELYTSGTGVKTDPYILK